MCYDVQGSIHSLILVRYFIVKIFYDVMYDSLLGVVCQKKRSKKNSMYLLITEMKCSLFSLPKILC